MIELVEYDNAKNEKISEECSCSEINVQSRPPPPERLRVLSQLNTLPSILQIFDANDESTAQYFHRSDMMYFDGVDLSFQSKSNLVVAQFVSDGQFNFPGFNATYKGNLNR